MARVVTPATVSAAALYTLWRRSEGEARSLISDGIAGYVRRNPATRDEFDAALRLLEVVRTPGRATGDEQNALKQSARGLVNILRWMRLSGPSAHAQAIFSAWMGADAELRAVLQAYVALEASCEPQLLAWLKRLSTLPQRRRPVVDASASDEVCRWILFE